MNVQRPDFLYRVTTRGWPGNDTNQAEMRTCATTDPLVATVFAVYCRNFGAAVVHVFKTEGYEILESTNCMADVEADFIIPVTPDDFATAAACTMMWIRPSTS